MLGFLVFVVDSFLVAVTFVGVYFLATSFFSTGFLVVSFFNSSTFLAFSLAFAFSGDFSFFALWTRTKIKFDITLSVLNVSGEFELVQDNDSWEI